MHTGNNPFAYARIPFRRAARGCLSLLAASALLSSALLAQDKDASALEAGHPVERELVGGQSHSYRIALTAGQFLHVVVEQRGIDVVVTLFAPSGEKVAEVDSPNGSNGPEPIFWITEAAGEYLLEVRSLEAGAAAGRYEAKIEGLRAATEEDRRRVAAENAAEAAFAEALQLEGQGSEESLRKAIEKLEGSLPLRRVTGDRTKEAMTFNYIGNLRNALGEVPSALESYNQALPILQATGDRYGQAAVLNNIARVYDYSGEKQRALDTFNQSLPLIRAVGEHGGEAVVLNNIGLLYATLGEERRAIEFYNQALPLNQSVGDRKSEAMNLVNTGAAFNSLGEKQKALDFYHQALLINRETRDQTAEAYTLNNIGIVYGEKGEKEKALDFLNRALALSRSAGDLSLQVRVLDNIGKNYVDLKEQQKAIEYFQQALSLSRRLGERPEEAHTLYLWAQAERAGGNLVEARRRIEAALAIVESLRTKIASQDLRASYFSTVQQYYELYIDLLMGMHKLEPGEGHDAAALQVSERARARALLETLAEAHADIREGVDVKLVERERSLQHQLNAKGQAQMKLLGDQHTEEQAASIASDIDALTTEFQQVEAQIRQTSPRYAALTQPQPLSLKDIQTQVLDADTMLLEYSLGAERSYLWAVTLTSINSYELPKREEIEKSAKLFYASLTAPSPVRRTTSEKRGMSVKMIGQASGGSGAEAAVALSRMLLAPVARQLGRKRLVIVSDGALQYVPFGALPSPSSAASARPSPLIVEHEIVTLPSASTLSVLRREAAGRRAAPKTIAVLADPVFDAGDERVKTRGDKKAVSAEVASAGTQPQRGVQLTMAKAAEESGVASDDSVIPRLPGTRREARQILSLVPVKEQMEALDFAASRGTAMSPGLGQYRYVHFATHGFLNSQHPELSGIILSMSDEQGRPQDGFLRAHEVFNMKLAAEVVVLSACQTGLGKEVRGEGLVGLTRGFMYAGSPRVVVSLWSVSDVGTAELMTRFYRSMLRDKLTPARALQAAQISMLKERQFASPYFWAAFTLQGEWR